MFVWKDENKQKEAGNGQIKETFAAAVGSNYSNNFAIGSLWR